MTNTMSIFHAKIYINPLIVIPSSLFEEAILMKCILGASFPIINEMIFIIQVP